jgi:hypothetical protein
VNSTFRGVLSLGNTTGQVGYSPFRAGGVHLCFLVVSLVALAILAIEKVPHRLPAGGVRFALRLALHRVLGGLRGGRSSFLRAAFRAAVGETRLVGLQFELL